MTLIIKNDDVAKVLTMGDTIAALETAYAGLAADEAVCRPRIDIRIPTANPAKNYQWGTMEGGSTSRLFRHPHEIRRGVRDRIQRASARRRNTAPRPACSAA